MFYNNKIHSTWEWTLLCIDHKCPEPEHSFMDSEKDFAALEKRKKTYCYTQLIYYQELKMHDCYRIVVTRLGGEFFGLERLQNLSKEM